MIYQPELELPIPEGDSVHSFTRDLIEAHHQYQEKLALFDSKVECQLPILRYINIPDNRAANIRPVLFAPKIEPSGPPLLLFEPHADDVALSLWGSLCVWRRPVIVVTVFGRSQNLHPQLRQIKDLNNEQIFALRQEEIKASLRFLKGIHYLLEFEEEPWPHSRPDISKIPELVESLRPFVEQYPDAEIMAPLCMSRHPDHMLVRRAVEELGCIRFWEDVDFYPNYARTVEDREYYRTVFSESLLCEYQPIAEVLLQKMAALSLYQSQYFPFEEMWGALRYNWAVAREGIRAGMLPDDITYAERTYRKP